MHFMQIDFAYTADIEAMADLLGELFTLESDFHPQRRGGWPGVDPRERDYRRRSALEGTRPAPRRTCAGLGAQRGHEPRHAARRQGQLLQLAFGESLGYQESAMVVRRLPL